MNIKDKLKKENLTYKIKETKDFVVITFEIIKPLKGQSKKFMEVSISEDRITAELNEGSYFAFQEFNYNKIDTEIAC